MTIDQAIIILDPDVTMEELTEFETYNRFRRMQTEIKALKDACLIAVEIMKRSRWIPCSERLPEIGTTVLTLDKRHNIRSRTIRAYMDGELYFTPDGLAPGRHITHWMPLPEQPEEVLP